MSQVGFEQALNRTGMDVRRGNLTEVSWSNLADGESIGNVALAGQDTSIFVVDWADAKIVDLETLARRDVIICTAVLDHDGTRTDYTIGKNCFDAKGADITVVFVPQHERFKCVATASHGFRAVSIIVDITSMMEARRLSPAALPKSLQRTVQRREIAVETLMPGYFGAIAREVASQRAMFPSFATLYYEGKAFELVSALLNGLSRRDNLQAGNGAFDPVILDRLELVKQIIDEAPPHRLLDVEAFARVAAMNRTKLRSAFKHVYGTTLSDYRTALMLQRADRTLRQGGASVKQAARHAGYATTSSFIYAYKRQYGVCPGTVLRD